MAASAIPSALTLQAAGTSSRVYRSGSFIAQGEQQTHRAILNGPGVSCAYDHGTGQVLINYQAGGSSAVTGRAAATHINKWLEGLGLTVKAHQFREEHRGPVVLASSDKSWGKARQYYLDEQPNKMLDINRGPYVATMATKAAKGSLIAQQAAIAVAQAAGIAQAAAAPGFTPNPTMPPTQAQAPYGGAFPTPEAQPADLAGRSGGKVPSIPDGFVQVRGRIGQPLVLPKRAVDTFETALKARRRGKPIHPLAIGPTGTGKTEGIVGLALQHGLTPLPIVACGGIETATDWFGQTRPDAASSSGWSFHASTLWKNLERALKNPTMEFLLLLDEVNRILTAAAQNALFSLMDGSSELQDPATGNTIELPKNVFLVASANIGAAYGSTQALDGAFRSRFATNLVFDYLPETVESIVLTNTGLSYDQSVILARASAELRSSARATPFRSHLIPGTRELLNVAELAKDDPEGVPGAWDSAITASFSADGNNPAQTERARVRAIAETVFKSKVAQA